MQRPNLYRFIQFILVIVAFATVGCGLSTTSLNDVISDELNLTNSPIEGIAAAGAPLDGIVFLKASGSSMSISTYVNDTGFYHFSDNQIDALEGTPPYILKIEGTVGGGQNTLYSIARTRGRININPISDLGKD